MSTSWPARDIETPTDYAPLRQTSLTGVGKLYILGSADGTRVKIGWSSKPGFVRIKQHRRGDAFGMGGDFQILAVVRCTKQAEAQVHAYFAPYVVDRAISVEVFHAAPVIPWICWLRDLYFVSTTEAEYGSVMGQDVMEALAWLPGPGRESARRAEPGLFHAIDPWSVLPSRQIMGGDWYTPSEIVEVARRILGAIDLDPCTHVVANAVVKAKQIYTLDTDGLLRPWAGRVWVNPPFSAWREWSQKAVAEWDRGQIMAMVLLGATRTLSAQYFETILRRSHAIGIITGRNAFWGMLSESTAPTDGHFFLYFGPEVEHFRREFQVLGASWQN